MSWPCASLGCLSVTGGCPGTGIGCWLQNESQRWPVSLGEGVTPQGQSSPLSLELCSPPIRGYQPRPLLYMEVLKRNEEVEAALAQGDSLRWELPSLHHDQTLHCLCLFQLSCFFSLEPLGIDTPSQPNSFLLNFKL